MKEWLDIQGKGVSSRCHVAFGNLTLNLDVPEFPINNSKEKLIVFITTRQPREDELIWEVTSTKQGHETMQSG